MITNPQNTDAPVKAKKRSVFGLLFNPQLGSSISPLRESTRIFVHLVASVFSIYKLIPKDYPGLRDQETRLSFAHILRTAWSNIRFTREGAPQAIIFFAVVGVMAVSLFAGISTIFSLFIGHAHAQASASAFQAESQDIAQSWINYLFNPSGQGSTYPTVSASMGGVSTTMEDPFHGSQVLQQSLVSALGFYSDAILIVAAIILFYHLAAMVVETAHHGVPMGKRASQIWAPIRLVVAIGLLVPISGGLSSGQYIVIKMAELGSGLASRTWDVFLQQMGQSSGQALIPSGTSVAQTVSDLVQMQACMQSWNYHITELDNAGAQLSSNLIAVNTAQGSVGGMTGTITSYDSVALADSAVCGSYFIPDGNGNALLQQAAAAQASAINASASAINKAASQVLAVVDQTSLSSNPPPAIKLKNNTAFQDAVTAYQTALDANLQSQLGSQQLQISTVLQQIKPYGWVMAGSFLNTINRIQAAISGAVADSTPKTTPPSLMKTQTNGENSASDGFDDTRALVAKDLSHFGFYQSRAIASNVTAQCAAMLGLNKESSPGAMTSALEYLLGKVDWLASFNGVWQNGTGTSCGGNSPSTFKLGVQISGNDPYAAMTYLGHANLKTAFDIVGLTVTARVATEAAKGVAGNIWVQAIPVWGAVAQGGAAAANAATAATAPLAFFIAMVFWTCGFTLAFLLPLMPFMRFFFAVLSWVAAIIEAIIAVPLVALAHLNPEGDGLPGQAKGAYFFVFNLFLRPVLTIFGLVCALVVFMVAVSFLNFAYAVAVSSGGATAYGMETLSKLIYSILYVVILYVCANHSFGLIDHIPQYALSWMGAQGQAMASMGDVNKIESAASLVSSYAGQQAAGSIGRGVGAFKGERNEQKQLKQRGEDKAEQQQNKQDSFDQRAGLLAGKMGQAIPPGMENNANYISGHAEGKTEYDSGQNQAAQLDAITSALSQDRQSGSTPKGTNPTSGFQQRMADRGMNPSGSGFGKNPPKK